jgi:hypothetical protein
MPPGGLHLYCECEGGVDETMKCEDASCENQECTIQNPFKHKGICLRYNLQYQPSHQALDPG